MGVCLLYLLLFEMPQINQRFRIHCFCIKQHFKMEVGSGCLSAITHCGNLSS